jgi:multidrug efflux pump subunit AcrA (membrane-fusion protein)
MNTEKRPLRIGLIVLAVVAVALSGWWALSRTTGTEVAAGGSTGEGLPAGTTAAGTTTLGEDEIAVVEARPGSISITVEGPPVVEPFRELAVRSGIAGTIVEATTVGDSVVAGDVLARFDGTTFRAALEQARLNSSRHGSRWSELSWRFAALRATLPTRKVSSPRARSRATNATPLVSPSPPLSSK